MISFSIDFRISATAIFVIGLAISLILFYAGYQGFIQSIPLFGAAAIVGFGLSTSKIDDDDLLVGGAAIIFSLFLGFGAIITFS